MDTPHIIGLTSTILLVLAMIIPHLNSSSVIQPLFEEYETTAEVQSAEIPLNSFQTTSLIPNDILDQPLPELFLVPVGWSNSVNSEISSDATSSLTDSSLHQKSDFSTDTTLLVTTADGYIHGIDPSSGEPIWSTLTGDYLTRVSKQYDTPSSSRCIFLPSFSGDLFSLDSTRGLTKLPLSIQKIVNSSPLSFGDSSLFLGEKKTKLFRLNVSNGNLSPIHLGESSTQLSNTAGNVTSQLPEILLGRTNYAVHILIDNLIDSPINVSYSNIYISPLSNDSSFLKPQTNFDHSSSLPFFFRASVSGHLSTFIHTITKGTTDSNRDDTSDDLSIHSRSHRRSKSSPPKQQTISSLKHLWDHKFSSPIVGLSLFEPRNNVISHYAIHPSMPESPQATSIDTISKTHAYIVPGPLPNKHSNRHNDNDIIQHSFVLDPLSNPTSMVMPSVSMSQNTESFSDLSISSLFPGYLHDRVPLAFDSISGYYSVSPYSPPLLESSEKISPNQSRLGISGTIGPDIDSSWNILPFVALLQFLAYVPSLGIVFAIGLFIYFSRKSKIDIDSTVAISPSTVLDDLNTHLKKKIFSPDGNKITFPQHNLSIFPNSILGYGSNGTIVYSGTFQDRPVAVKRMLKQFVSYAQREVDTLLSLDSLPYVVNYYAKIEDSEFIYLVLEKFECTLNSIYGTNASGSSSCSSSSTTTSSSSGSITSNSEESVDSNTNPDNVHIRKDIRHTLKDLTNSNNIELIHSLVLGVASLHSNNIIHRDLKPHNILIKRTKNTKKNNNPQLPRIVIGDLGVAKSISSTNNSHSAYARTGITHSAGTFGWEAPEIIHLREKMNNNNLNTSPQSLPFSKASDVFSLGCLIYYLYTQGYHPFQGPASSWRMVEHNIIKNNRTQIPQNGTNESDSSQKNHAGQKVPISNVLFDDLIQNMLVPNPKHRYTIVQVAAHPFFWSNKRKLEFILACSDMLEFLPSNHYLVNKFQNFAGSTVIPVNGWFDSIDSEINANISRYRAYDKFGIRDLLRVIRNKFHHFRELSPRLRILLGNGSEHFYFDYFNDIFPQLFICCWRFFWVTCPTEPIGFTAELVKIGLPPQPMVDYVTKGSQNQVRNGNGGLLDHTNGSTTSISPRSKPRHSPKLKKSPRKGSSQTYNGNHSSTNSDLPVITVEKTWKRTPKN